MIYFDNAATGGRKPDCVLDAVQACIRVCANPGRSGHKLSLSCANMVQECRDTLNEYFQGYGYDRCIFTKNCTEALNVALFGVLQKGDHVIVSCMEHNSVLRPLHELQRQGVITYDVCPLGMGGIDPKTFSSLLKPNTRMAVVTACSNVTGRMPDLNAIRQMLPKRVLLVVDGAQGAGHGRIDMQKTGIDALALAGHKGLFGIQGSGALLFSERMEPNPILFGGTGSMSILLETPDFYPDRLEAGTLAFPAIVSLLEGVRYLKRNEREIFKKLYALTEYFLGGLHQLSAYEVYSAPNTAGIVAFRHKRKESENIASLLSQEYDIAVRGGLHCAPLMHESLGTLDFGLVRVSFSHFNSFLEVDALLNALSAIEKCV